MLLTKIERGKFIPTGVPDTYGFNDIHDQTVTHRRHHRARKYTGGATGLESVVRFRWNGAKGVEELIGNTGRHRLGPRARRCRYLPAWRTCS